MKDRVCVVTASAMFWLEVLFEMGLLGFALRYALGMGEHYDPTLFCGVMLLLALIPTVVLLICDRRYLGRAFRTEILPTAPGHLRVSWKAARLSARVTAALIAIFAAVSFVRTNG